MGSCTWQTGVRTGPVSSAGPRACCSHLWRNELFLPPDGALPLQLHSVMPAVDHHQRFGLCELETGSAVAGQGMRPWQQACQWGPHLPCTAAGPGRSGRLAVQVASAGQDAVPQLAAAARRAGQTCSKLPVAGGRSLWGVPPLWLEAGLQVLHSAQRSTVQVGPEEEFSRQLRGDARQCTYLDVHVGREDVRRGSWRAVGHLREWPGRYVCTGQLGGTSAAARRHPLRQLTLGSCALLYSVDMARMVPALSVTPSISRSAVALLRNGGGFHGPDRLRRECAVQRSPCAAQPPCRGALEGDGHRALETQALSHHPVCVLGGGHGSRGEGVPVLGHHLRVFPTEARASGKAGIWQADLCTHLACGHHGQLESAQDAAIRKGRDRVSGPAQQGCTGLRIALRWSTDLLLLLPQALHAALGQLRQQGCQHQVAPGGRVKASHHEIQDQLLCPTLVSWTAGHCRNRLPSCILPACSARPCIKKHRCPRRHACSLRLPAQGTPQQRAGSGGGPPAWR